MRREAYTTGPPHMFLLHKLFAATKQVSSRMGQQLLGLFLLNSLTVLFDSSTTFDHKTYIENFQKKKNMCHDDSEGRIRISYIGHLA